MELGRGHGRVGVSFFGLLILALFLGGAVLVSGQAPRYPVFIEYPNNGAIIEYQTTNNQSLSQVAMRKFATQGTPRLTDPLAPPINNQSRNLQINAEWLAGSQFPLIYSPASYYAAVFSYRTTPTFPPDPLPYFSHSVSLNDTSVLAVDLMPQSGQLLRPLEGFNIETIFIWNFKCAKPGAVTVTWGLQIGGDFAALNFIKYCDKPQCGNSCVNNGTCNADTLDCECLPGYTTPFCQLGLYTDRAVVCAGQSVELVVDLRALISAVSGTAAGQSLHYMDFAIRAHVGDVVLVIKPSPTRPLSAGNWTVDEIQTYVATHNSTVYMRFPLSNDLASPPSTVGAMRGFVQVRLGFADLVGDYAIAYQSASQGKIIGVTTVRVLNGTAASCAAQANVSLAGCVNGIAAGAGASALCRCFPGFYGLRCEYGCAPFTYLNVSGSQPNVVRPGYYSLGSYDNNVQCSWVIRVSDALPSLESGAAFAIRFSAFGTELNRDYVRVYSGSGYNISAPYRQLSGLYANNDPNLFVVVGLQAQEMTITFQSDQLNPGFVGIGRVGFAFEYELLTCGSQFVDPRSGGCVTCPTDYYNTDTDLSFCTQCPSVEDRPSFREEMNPENACVLKPVAVAEAVQQVIFFICGCLAFVLGVCSLLLLRYRHSPILVGSSVGCLIVVLVGTFTLLIAACLYVIDATSQVCIAKTWLLAIGAQLVLAALFTRTYRIERIFNNKRLTHVNIPFSRMLVYMGLLAALDAVVLACWTVLANPRILDPQRRECVSDADGAVLGVLLLIKATLIGVTLWVTYLSRNIPARFNESKNQVWILYNVLFFVLVLGVVMGTLNPVENGIFSILVALTLAYLTLLSLSLLLITKFVAILRKRRHPTRRVLDSKTDYSSNPTSATHSTWKGFSEEDLRVARGMCMRGGGFVETANVSIIPAGLSRSHSELEIERDKEASTTLGAAGKSGAGSTEQKSVKPALSTLAGKAGSTRQLPAIGGPHLNLNEADIAAIFQRQMSDNAALIKEQDILVDRAHSRLTDVERELNFLVTLLWALDLDEQCGSHTPSAKTTAVP